MNTAIGPELKALRESRGITLGQAAAETCLRPGFLRELEDCTTAADFPDVYHKLSLRMYARYLGLEVEPARRAASRPDRRPRISPIGLFVRRMGRPPKPPRLSPAQRSRLVGIAKTTSAAVVTVLAIGLWSLNAKLSRLDIDETKPRLRAVVPAKPAPLPVVVEMPRCTLEEPVQLVLVPGA
jgi:cytoskeletal protein RodZ